MVILSMVGKQMRNMVGIAGRMFTTLAQGNVNIEMISQGANEINISCVLDGRDAIKALNLIHQSCLQIKPEGPKGRGQSIFIYKTFYRSHVDAHVAMGYQSGPGCSEQAWCGGSFLGKWCSIYIRASRAALEKSFRSMYVSGRPSLGSVAVQLCSTE
jgi:hypothetical protein